MKITIDWGFMIRKLRIFFLLFVGYVVYRFFGEFWGFATIAFFIMNDIHDIEIGVGELKEGHKEWISILSKRN